MAVVGEGDSILAQCRGEDWARQMRLRFSPADMCDARGDILQDYFKPCGLSLRKEDEERWGAPQQEAVYKGLEEHGVGRWRLMIEGHAALSAYTEATVRIKAARLLGTQSLARHQGWKGDRAAVEAEWRKHRAVGQQTGCWKGGVLVEDGQGSVAAALAAAAHSP